MYAHLSRLFVRSLLLWPVLLLASGLPLAATPILTLAGHLGGPALTVAVQDHYAYVGFSFEFAVVDVADPTDPRRAGYLVLSTNDVALKGDLAFVASRSGLVVVDVSDAARPTQVGAWPLGPAVSVAVAGDYAYVLTPDGLAVVDIARPTDPQGISAHALSGRPESVTLDGDRAYVATSRGLYVLDMRTPSQPVAESFLTTAGYAEAVAAADGMLYVAAGEQGLQVFTHSADAPSDTPVGAATLRLDSGYAEAIALAGRYALVAAGSGGVQVIDMAEPTRPSAAASLSLPGYALDLVVAGDYAYVIDRYHGMAVVDIAQPAAPRQVGLLATPGFTHNVNVDDTRVLVATSPQGAVHLLDSADPTHTRQAGWTAMPDIAESATVSGRYAYIASGYSGLEVVDLAAADGPTRLAQLDALGYAHDVQTADGFAYVVAEGGLQVVDMRDPMHPREVGCTYTTNTVVDMALTGHTGVILGNSGHLQWIDLTHPTVPATVASIQLAGRPNAVAAADDYVYVAGAEGLRIIAIDAAGGVGEVGGYATPGPVNDVVAAGGYVYLALLDQGVQVLDLADPGHPVAVAGFDTPDQARRLAVAGDTLYVADHAGGLFILRLLPRPA